MERVKKLQQALTDADRALIQRAQDATTAALVEYLHGDMERAIPLLQRSLELDKQRNRAYEAAFERAGLKTGEYAQVPFLQLLVLSHGRLARAYALTKHRSECLSQLAQAVELGDKAIEKMKSDPILREAVGVLGMDSPEKVLASVRGFDLADRGQIKPATQDAKRAAQSPYTPVKSDCTFEDSSSHTPRPTDR